MIVIKNIYKKQNEYISKFGVEPTHVYLGINQMRELVNYLVEMRVIIDRAVYGKGDTVVGLKIVCCVLDDKLEVGVEK